MEALEFSVSDNGVDVATAARVETAVEFGRQNVGESPPYAQHRQDGLTRVVVALESRGLVTRTPHPTDGRQVVIDLTPAAEELLGQEVRAREAWLCGGLQQLSAEERTVLREAAAIMDKLASG